MRIVHVVLFERPPKSADLPLLTYLLLQLFTWVIPTGRRRSVLTSGDYPEEFYEIPVV